MLDFLVEILESVGGLIILLAFLNFFSNFP